MGLYEEIHEQPAVLRHWLDTQRDAVQRAADAVRDRQIDYVFLAARGTSDHAGIYAQYLWGSRNRLPVALAAPSLFTMYPGTPRLEHALVVGISQSGQSPDIVEVVTEGRRQGAATVVITNDPGSPLAQAAEHTIPLDAGPERAVAATKTYTAELLAIAAFSAALAGDDPAVLAPVPDAVAGALTLDATAAGIAAGQRDLTHCVVLGRGYHYATAREWALKLKELAYVLADAYSPADFQHGPIAIVDRGFPILAVAPSGAVQADQIALLARLRDDYGADLLVVSDDPAALALGRARLPLPADVPEWLQPIVSIVPAQLYTYHLTRAKGYDPDHPRTLSKVTRTQ